MPVCVSLRAPLGGGGGGHTMGRRQALLHLCRAPVGARSTAVSVCTVGLGQGGRLGQGGHPRGIWEIQTSLKMVSATIILRWVLPEESYRNFWSAACGAGNFSGKFLRCLWCSTLMIFMAQVVGSRGCVWTTGACPVQLHIPSAAA